MFNSSLRRAARSRPNGSLSSRPTTPSIATFTSHSHQRRHSSSKPPVPPNNGSSTIPASSVKQVGTSRTESKRPGSESRLSKRKAAKAEQVEDAPQDNWTATLPSVPNVHLNKKDLSIAAFYATYRPISITGPGPREAQLDDLEKIFQPKPKSKYKHAQQDVIYTLSTALENLDQHVSDKQSSQQDASPSDRSDLIRALTQHNDATPQQGDNQHQTINVRVPNGTVKLVIQEIQNRFRPYNVPPPPTPIAQQELDALDAENAEANEEAQAQDLEAQISQQDEPSPRRPRSRTKKSLAETPVAEVFQANGDSFSIDLDMQSGHFFTPHYNSNNPNPNSASSTEASSASPPTHPRVKLSHRIRRGFSVPVRIPRRNRDGVVRMRLISVKRQRRLKMKKHKYKKLMRKTRNLRKREGRL